MSFNVATKTNNDSNDYRNNEAILSEQNMNIIRNIDEGSINDEIEMYNDDVMDDSIEFDEKAEYLVINQRNLNSKERSEGSGSFNYEFIERVILKML